MILCLDAGNTRLKAGLADGSAWVWQQAVPTAEVLANPDTLARQLSAARAGGIHRAVACNVAGPAMQAALEALTHALGCPLHWLRSSGEAHGVRNAYACPEQLGHDRWAALIGARGLVSGACVVVMAGTATTIDALDAEGCFRGGLILPGLRLMRRALAGATAQLPDPESAPCRDWPDNTVDAIVSGSLRATAGAIEHLRAQLAADAPQVPATVPCLLAGGAAGELAPLLAAPLRPSPTLVLDGLLRSARALPALDTAQCPPSV